LQACASTGVFLANYLNEKVKMTWSRFSFVLSTLENIISAAILIQNNQ
jgi:hypothetical protein